MLEKIKEGTDLTGENEELVTNVAAQLYPGTLQHARVFLFEFSSSLLTVY